MTVDFISLGCSKNLVDSENLMGMFEAKGIHVTHDSDDLQGEVVVVNTCGFIADAKEESINTILEQVARKNAGEYIITDQQGRVISGSQPTFPIVGVGSVILGLTLALTPGVFVNGLMYILGAIMILGGINQLMALVSARRLGSVPFGFWVAPSLILIVGLFVILKPMESAEMPLLILGWCCLLYGVTEIINALKIRSIRKMADRQSVETTVAEEISSHIGDDTLDVGLQDVDASPIVPSPGND